MSDLLGDDAMAMDQEEQEQELPGGTDPPSLTPLQLDDLQPESDFVLLKQALLNERVAPDILDYKAELVQRVKDALEDCDTTLDELEADSSRKIEYDVVSLDRDRMRYLLKACLRTRLDKVEKFAGAILMDSGLRGRLSDQERTMAHNVFVALGKHLKTTALEALPANYQSLTKQHEGDPKQSMITHPDVNTFVFCRTLTDVGNIADGDHGETVELLAGDMHVIRYQAVAEHVRAGQVCLL